MSVHPHKYQSTQKVGPVLVYFALRLIVTPLDGQPRPLGSVKVIAPAGLAMSLPVINLPDSDLIKNSMKREAMRLAKWRDEAGRREERVRAEMQESTSFLEELEASGEAFASEPPRKKQKTETKGLGSFSSSKWHGVAATMRPEEYMNNISGTLSFNQKKSLLLAMDQIWDMRHGKVINEAFEKFCQNLPENEIWQGEHLAAPRSNKALRQAFNTIFTFLQSRGHQQARREAQSPLSTGHDIDDENLDLEG